MVRQKNKTLALHGDFFVVVDGSLWEAALLKAAPALEVDRELFGPQHSHRVFGELRHVGNLDTLVDVALRAIVGLHLWNIEVRECGITVLEMQRPVERGQFRVIFGCGGENTVEF